MVASLYSLCVPSGFGGRAGMSTNHASPQGLLAVITWIGNGRDMEGLESVLDVS